MRQDMSSIFGDPISVYTRAQALEDGELVDVTETAKEAGFKWPVAITRHVFTELVALPTKGARAQDERGRLWDVVWMASLAARRGADTYTIVATMADGRKRRVTLVGVAGPGDDGEPIVTIMFPEDD